MTADESPQPRRAAMFGRTNPAWLAFGGSFALLVVLVGPGNPDRVKAWDDLLRPDVRVGLANEGAAIGKLTREHLERTGKWTALDAKGPDRLGMVTQVANAVELAAVDAGVVWDAV